MASSTVLPVRPSVPQSSNVYSSSSDVIKRYDACVLASWERAIEIFNSKLTHDEKKKIDLSKCHSASFEELLKAAAAAKTRAEQKRFRWTPTVQKIFQKVNRYAFVGDIITQYNTEYTSIAWGSFRFLLLFLMEEGTMAEKLSEALDSLVPIILRAQEYASLFSSHSGSSTAGVFMELQDHLSHLYAEVLNFLVRATIFFTKGTLRRNLFAGFSPFETQFKNILDRVSKLESDVTKDVALLNSEAENRRQECEDGIWLKPADFSTNLKDLLQRHLPGTSTWFLQSDTYRHWRESTQVSSNLNLLWLQGKPGAGKSFLAAQIVTDLKTLNDDIKCHVFCKSGEENKSDLKDILRNLIYQIICASSGSKSSLNQMVRNARLGARTPHAQNMTELWNVLRQMLGKDIRVWCIIDGLDECSDSAEELVFFLNHIAELFHTSKAATKLAVISRLDMSGLKDASLWASVQIRSSDVQGDIEKIVSVKMQESAVLNKHKEKDRLQRKLVEGSDGMILWAELMIKELEADHWDAERVLRHPPKGLGAVYAAIFRRLSTSTVITEVRSILQLLLVAARPLRLDELSMGVALLKGLRSHADYVLRGDPDREGKDIIQKSNPLLTVMPDNTIQLAHSSLKDFLLNPEYRNRYVLNFAWENLHFELPGLRSILASCLITYLSFECFNDETGEEGLQATSLKVNSLLNYSTLYLITHSVESPPSTELAENLTAFFRSVSGWQWLQRLDVCHGISFGHLQLMQSRLKSWSSSPYIDEKYRETLGNLLLVLAERRYQDSKSFPVEHGKHLAAMSALATSCRAHGKLDRAEELFVQVMETTKRVLGEEHPETLTSIANLASTYRNQGRWKEAEVLQMQVMETSKRVLGEKHPETLTSMANLASTYWNQGRWKEAEELEMQVMETSKRVLGEEHPATLTSMANLASTYSNQGRWKEAEELQMQVLETSKRVLGEEHPETLSGMANLASIFWNQGRWKEAEELQMQVLKTSKRVLGEEHPSTLTSMANLASTFWNQGRWNEAEELEAQVMETSKRELGEEHPSTLNRIANLASTYINQGRWKEAEELFVQVMETSKRVLGEGHPMTLTSMANLASTLLNQGRWKEAEELGMQVMETRKRVLGEKHPETLTSMANVASTYSKQGRWKEAEELELHVLETSKRVLGEEHPSTLTSMANLASTYRNQARWKEAEEIQRSELELCSRVLGQEHPDMLISMRNFAFILKGQERNDEALKFMGECVQLRKKVLGTDHPYTKSSISVLEEWERECCTSI